MSFAERLKDARRVCGLSQEELAERLDVSRQAVGKWEQGQAYPEMEKLIALCAVLNVSAMRARSWNGWKTRVQAVTARSWPTSRNSSTAEKGRVAK